MFPIDILVLDFNRPLETRVALDSIRDNFLFPHYTTLLSNGGEQEYCWEFYKLGLVNRLILNDQNLGLGIGTTDLFKSARNKYSILFQNDQFVTKQVNENKITEIISILGKTTDDGKRVMSVSLAGNHCQSRYSERGHLISNEFYNSIPNKSIHGAGPFHAGVWNEEIIQKYYEENNFCHYIYREILIGDNGCFAVRQNPDGSVFRHRTDTKQLWLISGPVKEKFVYPKFTEEEWNQVLATQSWEPGKIPQNEIAHSFLYWK